MMLLNSPSHEVLEKAVQRYKKNANYKSRTMNFFKKMNK